jgi:hypothetical protein
MLKAYSTEFWGWLLAGATGTVMCGATAVLSGHGLFWIGAIGIMILAMVAAADRARWAWRAAEYLSAWNAAQPHMPKADRPQVEEISWCDLRAAGFSLQDVPAAYAYQPWRFGGRPWKLLEHGDLRIPVFKYPRQWKGLFPQHFVRMTGYCLLLEKCTDYRSPYGVIVRTGSLRATIVPKTARSQRAFADTLRQARETIKGAREMNLFPPEPLNRNICRDCPWGEPYLWRRGIVFRRDGNPIDRIPVRGRNKKKYHSHCGDRFGWMPPHERLELPAAGG